MELKRPATEEEIRCFFDRLIEMGESREDAAHIVEGAEIYVRPRSPVTCAGLGDGVMTLFWATFPVAWLRSRPPEMDPATLLIMTRPLALDPSYSMEGELETGENGEEVLILRRYGVPAEGTAASEASSPSTHLCVLEAKTPPLDGDGA
jgi:hypothetical protein